MIVEKNDVEKNDMEKRYRLSTDHAASSYGMPILAGEDDAAYGPQDILPEGFRASDYVERGYIQGWPGCPENLVRPFLGFLPEGS